MTLTVAFLHETLRSVDDFLLGDSISEMALRALLVYFFALLLVKVGKSRMLSNATIFDAILAFVLGSMLSRAINGGDVPLIPSFAAAATLVAIHAVMARAAFHSHKFGNFIKGHTDVLVRDGEIDRDAMHEHHLSERDLKEAMHRAGLRDIDLIERAYFERDGKISIVPRPRVFTVDVEEGVQRVRIEL